MVSLRNELDLYIQELLSLQFKASNGITHNPTKGTLREKFIKQEVLNQYPALLLKSGILVDEGWQSSQVDFIWLKENARVGNFNVYELSDCKMFMEIKSCAKHSEFMDLNTVSEEIHMRAIEKNPEHHILTGMFCYSTEASEKTVLRKFGFKYDKELQGYLNYDAEIDILKEIDFLVSLNISEDNETSPYIVKRDFYGNCVLYNNNPIINNFFNYFKSI